MSTQRQVAAHRLSWILAHGDVLDPVVCVLHDCPDGDNPACVNPDHLFLGTQADNVRDMDAKGRRRAVSMKGVVIGERHGGAKLTADKVRAIRQARADGVRAVVLAELYGVKSRTIDSVNARRLWAHVE